uniref:Uncharacterized protein n=1 Tax=Plectus sambesii TaxID=2011161 RepID=A0A914VKS5_9BILA
MTRAGKCHTRGLANRPVKQSAVVALLLLRTLRQATQRLLFSRWRTGPSAWREKAIVTGGSIQAEQSFGRRVCRVRGRSTATPPSLLVRPILLYWIVCRRAVIDHSAPCVDPDQASANRAQTVCPPPSPQLRCDDDTLSDNVLFDQSVHKLAVNSANSREGHSETIAEPGGLVCPIRKRPPSQVPTRARNAARARTTCLGEMTTLPGQSMTRRHASFVKI